MVVRGCVRYCLVLMKGALRVSIRYTGLTAGCAVTLWPILFALDMLIGRGASAEYGRCECCCCEQWQTAVDDCKSRWAVDGADMALIWR